MRVKVALIGILVVVLVLVLVWAAIWCRSEPDTVVVESIPGTLWKMPFFQIRIEDRLLAEEIQGQFESTTADPGRRLGTATLWVVKLEEQRTEVESLEVYPGLRRLRDARKAIEYDASPSLQRLLGEVTRKWYEAATSDRSPLSEPQIEIIKFVYLQHHRVDD